MIKRITVQWLEEHGTCEIDLFRATFGEFADATPENFDKAVAAGMNVEWLSELVCDASALAEYERVKASALRSVLFPNGKSS